MTSASADLTPAPLDHAGGEGLQETTIPTVALRGPLA
jgi:hypothetical protein